MKKKRSKDKISVHFEAEDHDEKTCFRCRLHDLYMELKEHNDIDFMLFAMAEACGSILSQMDDEMKIHFMLMVTRSYYEDKEKDKEEAMWATKH
jgi:hypothetical protein